MKMYKKPIIETTPLKTDGVWMTGSLSPAGNTSEVGSGLEGAAPQRRTPVF